MDDTWGALATGITVRARLAQSGQAALTGCPCRSLPPGTRPEHTLLTQPCGSVWTPPCRCPPPFHSGKPLLIFPTSAPPSSPPSPAPHPCADVSLWVFPTHSALHTMSPTQLHCPSSLAFYLPSPVPLLIFVGQIQGTQQALNTGRTN